MTAALLVAALLAVQGVPPPAAPTPEARGRGYFLYLQGRMLDGAGDAAGATQSYRDALALLPGEAVIHAELAGLYARQNQIVEARREAMAALALAPDNRDANRLLGGIKAATVESLPPGSTESLVVEAIQHFEQALAGGFSDPAAELALCNLYVRHNEAPKAIDLLRKFLLDRPDFPPAMRLLVKAFEAAGQTEEALTTLAALGRVQPDAVQDLIRQIERMERGGRWADAASAWSQVIGHDPGSTIYRGRQATALANSGNLDDARSVLRVATRESPRNVSTWYLLALIEARAGNAAAADEAAKRIDQIAPGDARGPLAMARARVAAGDYRGAAQALTTRVGAPKEGDVTSGVFAEMAVELSTAFTRLGQGKRAVEVLEGARKHAPKDQDLLFSLAASYEQDHRYDHAERAFRELIVANASHAQALNYLGYMLADRGQKLSEAVDLINRALMIDKDNPAYLDSLGWAYFKMGQFDSARQPLERAASALPKASVIHDHLGDLYVQMKRYSDAVAAFERALAGDRDGIDSSSITKKRDRARGLAGKS